jgi:hypothetical protein
VAVHAILLIPPVGNAAGTGPDNNFILELEPGHCAGCQDEIHFVYPGFFDIGYASGVFSGFSPVFIWNSSMSFVGCQWGFTCSEAPGIAYLGDGVIGAGIMEWTHLSVTMTIDSLTFTNPPVATPDPRVLYPCTRARGAASSCDRIA